MRFALVNSEDDSIVYDEVQVINGERTLITLRMQLENVEDTGSFARLVWENLAPGASSVSVVWQQAWGGTSAGGSYPLALGLANAGFVRTSANTVQNKEYPWAVNAIGIRAAGRFQLPLLDTLPAVGMTPGGDAENMGWKSTVSGSAYDLQTGELYWDAWQKAILAYDSVAEWTCVWQPERTLLITANRTWNTGDEKNIVLTGSAGVTVTLDTTVANIAPGTVVRVAWHPSVPTTGSLAVSCGQASSVLITANTGRTFVFYNDGGTGRWLAC